MKKITENILKNIKKYQPEQCLNCRKIKGVDCKMTIMYRVKCKDQVEIWDKNGKYITGRSYNGLL